MTDTQPAGEMQPLPCPFCGGEAKLYEVGLRPDYGYIVGCADCEGQAGDTDDPWLQAGYAIAQWNRRVDSAERTTLTLPS